MHHFHTFLRRFWCFLFANIGFNCNHVNCNFTAIFQKLQRGFDALRIHFGWNISLRHVYKHNAKCYIHDYTKKHINSCNNWDCECFCESHMTAVCGYYESSCTHKSEIELNSSNSNSHMHKKQHWFDLLCFVRTGLGLKCVSLSSGSYWIVGLLCQTGRSRLFSVCFCSHFSLGIHVKP